MKRTALILLLAATAAIAAQTPAKPATATAPAAKPAVAGSKSPAASSAMKLPPGVPAVKGVIKTAFSLRYQDTKIGAGPVAEPNKMYKVHYTGWLAADGRKFDSSYDHPRQPLKDKDGKPVMDADGKPKLDDPQPISFPQGFGRVIPGWDQGFEGMKVGGKRRIFIPWQLAYGARGRLTGDPKNPGIPPKADLIFDVELVAIDELPTPPQRPGMGGVPPGARPMPGANPPHPPVNGQPNAAPAPAASGSPAAPATPATPGAPAAPGATPAPAKPAAPATPAPTPAPAAPPAQGTPATPATPPQPH